MRVGEKHCGCLPRHAAPERKPALPSPAPSPQPHDWIDLPGGEFTMGSDAAEGYPEDGEGPARRVFVSPFALARTTVTNAQFNAFVRATRHITDAEAAGESFVFWLQASAAQRRAVRRVPRGLPWWLPVEGACWQRPEGPGSSIEGRLDHPVVHVSWQDAQAYCAWAGVRLPSEAEWEFAARSGRAGARFPWGDTLDNEGARRANLWQGRFPDAPAAGWQPGPMRADALPPNAWGLHHITGNVWQWCADAFSPTYHLDTPARDPLQLRETGRRSLRGGSFLCHASYCHRYRVAARSANSPASAASNVGFRVAAGRAPRPAG